MVDAALVYAGVERLAELAAAHVARPVAIVVPAHRFAASTRAGGGCRPALRRTCSGRGCHGGNSARRPFGCDLTRGAVVLVTNMNATARGIFGHRHTVAYRLQRVRELTRLDPLISEDRERLGLGLKAYRIVAPALPR